MALPNKNNVFIDKGIPIEMQIDYLRKGFIDRKLATYKVLKDKLGEEGEQLFSDINEYLLQQLIKDVEMKLEFEDIKRTAGERDKILGYRLKRDYEKPDELQISMLNCPYWERAKQYGLEKEVCKLVCEWEAEQAKKTDCEMAILSKIAEGAEKCTLRIRMKK